MTEPPLPPAEISVVFVEAEVDTAVGPADEVPEARRGLPRQIEHLIERGVMRPENEVRTPMASLR